MRKIHISDKATFNNTDLIISYKLKFSKKKYPYSLTLKIEIY